MAGDVILESGQVVRLEGRMAVIEIPRNAACAGCAAVNVCHSLSGSDTRELRALNDIGAEPGDQVEVQIPTSAAVKAAVWVYAIPTLLMVITAIFTHYATRNHLGTRQADLITAGAAVTALGLFIGLAWLLRRIRPPSTRGYPVVVRVDARR